VKPIDLYHLIIIIITLLLILAAWASPSQRPVACLVPSLLSCASLCGEQLMAQDHEQP